MAFIIQAVTLAGNIIDSARWEVAPSVLLEGQTFQVNIPSKDPDLAKYVARNGKQECFVERDDGSVTATLVVKQVRHMLEVSKKEMDTLVVVMPKNRTVELVLTFLLNPDKCDERFVRAVRSKEA